MDKRQLKIISGGQTGADRAALDVAIEVGADYGGAIPKGRKTEDGSLAHKYEKMTELTSQDYRIRTEKNVKDGDATIIFTFDRIGNGSVLTMKLAEKHNKPYLHINLSKRTDQEVVTEIKEWLNKTQPNILNVAGSRESTSKGIYERVSNILTIIISDYCNTT